MSVGETKICNMALGRIGAKRINNLDDDTTVEAIQCQTHYKQTRNALLRSVWWVFASDRAKLVEDTESPDFDWDNQFILPSDYLRFKSVLEEDSYSDRIRRHDIEGNLYLTNFSIVKLRYIKLVEDTTLFDSLFVEALILSLALKLAPPLTGANAKLQEILQKEFDVVISKARVANNQEEDTTGRNELVTWNDARY